MRGEKGTEAREPVERRGGDRDRTRTTTAWLAPHPRPSRSPYNLSAVRPYPLVATEHLPAARWGCARLAHWRMAGKVIRLVRGGEMGVPLEI
eukprot:scaffold153557_cov30-Tisochrysis_lutea.AAC.1